MTSCLVQRRWRRSNETTRKNPRAVQDATPWVILTAQFTRICNRGSQKRGRIWPANRRTGRMFELLGLVGVWCLFIAAAVLLGRRRRRQFEGALAAAGFIASSPAVPLPDVFHRPGAVVTRVVTES